MCALIATIFIIMYRVRQWLFIVGIGSGWPAEHRRILWVLFIICYIYYIYIRELLGQKEWCYIILLFCWARRAIILRFTLFSHRGLSFIIFCFINCYSNLHCAATQSYQKLCYHCFSFKPTHAHIYIIHTHPHNHHTLAISSFALRSRLPFLSCYSYINTFHRSVGVRVYSHEANRWPDKLAITVPFPARIPLLWH